MEEDPNAKKPGTSVECAVSNIYIDNLLCYASTARHSLKNDEIIRICVAFYKETDIIKSKDVLCDFLGQKGIR